MNVKREMDTIGKLMLAFVTLIIGVVLIAQVATTGSTVTSTTGVNNETMTIPRSNDNSGTGRAVNTSVGSRLTNYPTGWKVTDCPITSLVVRNQTGNTLTLNTDYNFTASTGVIGFLNTLPVNQSGSNTTGISYIYCGDTYLNSDWGRTVLNLVPGFFALAILLASVALFYSVARDAGIIA